MSRIANAFRALGGVLTGFASATGRQIGLVPSYLSHLLYLIDNRFLSLIKEAYGGNPAVYAVMRFLATSVAEPPLVAYIREDDGEPGEPLDYTHPLRDLIRKPNPFLTEFEHYELITMHLAASGRYTAYKERNNLGQPIAIWPLRPDRTGPVYGDTLKGEPPIVGWSYRVPGTGDYIGIPAADVMFTNLPDPSGESGGLVEGLGPLQVLATEVSTDNEATRFVGSMLANHAQPGTVIAVKREFTSKDDALLIKAGFMADFGGIRRGEPAVIDADSTITPIGFTLQQLEFPNLRKISESRIAAAFGVPAVLVGLLVGISSGIKATTDELRALFAETTLPAYWRRYAEMFTNDLALEFGDNIICRHDLSEVKALAAQSQIRVQQVADGYSNGAITRAEYRESMGYASTPADDVYVFGIARGRGVEVDTPVAGEGNPDAEDANTNADEQATVRSIRANGILPRPKGNSVLTDNGVKRRNELMQRPSTDKRVDELRQLLHSKTQEQYSRAVAAEAAKLGIKLDGMVTDPQVIDALGQRASWAAGKIQATYQTQLAKALEDGSTASDLNAARAYKPEQIWNTEMGLARHQAMSDFYTAHLDIAAQTQYYVDPGSTAKPDGCEDLIGLGTVDFATADANPLPLHVGCPHQWQSTMPDNPTVIPSGTTLGSSGDSSMSTDQGLSNGHLSNDVAQALIAAGLTSTPSGPKTQGGVLTADPATLTEPVDANSVTADILRRAGFWVAGMAIATARGDKKNDQKAA